VNIRVALVDPHAQYRNHVAGLLTREGDIDVVAQTDSLRDFCELAAAAAPPEVAVFDIDSPAGGGIAALARAAERHPGLRIVALCLHADAQLAAAALAAGARACVAKDAPISALLAAVRGRNGN
jgi:DNA-binding NarL/FixJ family response regulator